jgi:hypothetical protein
VQLKGGISERELVGAGIKSEAFFKRVAEDTGIGLKEVEKKISEGKIKANVLIEALYSEIAAKTGKPLGGAGVAMSQTYLAQLEKTKDILPNLFEELEKSGGFTKVTAGLSRLVQGLDPDSPAGGKIIKGLESMIDSFGDLISTIDFEAWAGRLTAGMEIIKAIVWFGAGIVQDLGKVFSGLTDLGTWLGGAVFDLVSFVGPFFKAAADLGGAIWKGLKDGIIGGVTEVVDSVKYLGKEAVGAVKGVLGIQSPSKVFADVGLMTGEGFEVGVEKSRPGVANAVERTYAPAAIIPPVTGAPAALTPMPILPGSSAGVEAGAGAAVGQGRPVFSASVTVNVNGAQGDADEQRALGETIAQSMRRQMESLFERLAAEGAAT